MSDEENKEEKRDKGSYAASVITTSDNLKKFKKKLEISKQSTEQKGT